MGLDAIPQMDEHDHGNDLATHTDLLTSNSAEASSDQNPDEEGAAADFNHNHAMANMPSFNKAPISSLSEIKDNEIVDQEEENLSPFKKILKEAVKNGLPPEVAEVIDVKVKNGMRISAATNIIEHAVKNGFGKQEVSQLCFASMSGYDNEKLNKFADYLAGDFSPQGKMAFNQRKNEHFAPDNTKSSGRNDAQPQSNIASGFGRLLSFGKREEIVEIGDKDFKKFESAIHKMESVTHNLLKSDYAKTLNQAKSSISSPEEIEKFSKGFLPDKKSASYISDMQKQIKKVDLESRKLLLKAKDPEQAEMIMGRIKASLDAYDAEFKDKLSFMKDSNGNPLSKLIDKISDKLTTVFKALFSKFQKDAETQDESSSLNMS